MHDSLVGCTRQFSCILAWVIRVLGIAFRLGPVAHGHALDAACAQRTAVVYISLDSRE
jgi:hypothetical protein